MDQGARTTPAYLDVLVVGAGLSGVGAAHFLRTSCPWASFAVLEARDAIGGTWDLFRYPGVHSDSDMHTLGYTFRPWQGETSIADGASILAYIRDTAAAEGVESRIRFHHRVVAADWSSTEGRWHVRAERTDTAEAVELQCGFLFSCTGYYRYDHGYLPDFSGKGDFAGVIVHPQAWPEDLDVADKRVVVIGSGATAVTLVPALAQRGAHVTMVQRSPTYIGSVPETNRAVEVLRKMLPPKAAGTAAKWVCALETQAFYRFCRLFPELARRLVVKGAEHELPTGYDVATHFSPTYGPWDQRFCAAPDGDFFAAICLGHAEVRTQRIERFTTRGLLLASGEEVEADIVVTATGLDMLFLGGMALRVDGQPVDPASRLVYKGMMLEDVPNLAFAVGYTNASWTLKCDLTSDYVCRLLTHLRASGHTTCTPRNVVGARPHGALLGLTSGYVTRAADRLPKQGDRDPWRVHQSYLRDFRALKMHGVEDPSMEFSGATVSVPQPVPATR